MTGNASGIMDPEDYPETFDVPLTIGVIADTHILPRGARRIDPEILRLFERFDVDVLLHAGDVATARVLDTLNEVAPVIAVHGNADERDLLTRLPLEHHFSVGEHQFVLLHGHGARTARTAARRFASEVDCVVYGHSHIPKIELEAGTILFNPGSATDRRWQPHFGIGIIRVSQVGIAPELILYLDPRHLANVG